MAKILIFNDYHINIKLFNFINSKGVPARYSEIAGTFSWLRQLIEKHGVDRVFFNGDLFNSTQNLTGPFFNLAFSGMHSLQVSLDIIDGNHDKYDNIYKVIEPFKVFSRVHSVPEAYYDPTLQMKLAFIPFQRTVEEANNAVQKLTEDETPTIVCIHQGVTGHYIDPLAIDKRIYNKDHIIKVFGGHYHTKFEDPLGNDDQRIIYPGSIISLHFDDNLQSKYCVIYNTKTNEVVWEENPHTAFFISLKQSQIKELKDKLESLAPVSYLRVVLEPGESLKVSMALLHKFKGYVTTTGKQTSLPYSATDAAYLSKDAFNYQEFSDLVRNSEETLSYDITPEQFNDLIIQSNEDTALLKQTSKAVLKDVLSEAYVLGNN